MAVQKLLAAASALQNLSVESSKRTDGCLSRSQSCLEASYTLFLRNPRTIANGCVSNRRFSSMPRDVLASESQPRRMPNDFRSGWSGITT
jgi:hypothetical protein